MAVIRKLAKIATALGLLTAGYVGYCGVPGGGRADHAPDADAAGSGGPQAVAHGPGDDGSGAVGLRAEALDDRTPDDDVL